MKYRNQSFFAFLFTFAALGGSPLFADITPPVGAGNLSPANGATGISIHPVLIAKTVTDPSGSIMYRFQLYQNPTCSGSPLLYSGSQESTSWSPANSPNSLSYSTIYSWHNQLQDGMGNRSPFGPCWSFTTLPPPGSDTQAPTSPSELVANPISSTQIKLSWLASNDNVRVEGYKIFRSPSDAGPYNQIESTTSQYFFDLGLDPNTRYFYFVQAYDAAGNVSGAVSANAITFLSSGGGSIGGGSGARKPAMSISPEPAY